MSQGPPITGSPGPGSPTSERDDLRQRRLARFAPSQRRSDPGRAYTVFVGSMKAILPAVALTIIGLVVFWPKIQPEPEPIIDETEAAAIEHSGSMARPRFFSTDDESRPYSIIANEAEQSRDGSVIDLQRPEAELTLKDGTWLALIADRGWFDQAQENVRFLGRVNLFRDDGVEFVTEEAFVDLSSGNAWGDVPIAGHGPFGELIADGFRIDDNNSVVVFTGRSRLLLRQRGEESS